MAVLVADHAGLVDGRLGVHVVGAHPDEDLEGVALVGGRHVGARGVGVPERPALEVLELVVGGEAGEPGVRVGVVVLQRRGVRPDVVVRRDVAGAVGARAELRGTVAAAAGEDGHEEVHDAVLVRVVVRVVDLRVRDRGRVADELAGRAAARVDLLQRADARQRADDRGAVGVRAVEACGAGELVDAVLDAVRVERRALLLGRGVGEGRADARVAGHLALGEVEAGRVGEVLGRDAVRGDGAVGVELAERHLLVEVERRPREVGGVDDGVEVLVVRLVGAVVVRHRHDRERAVAVPRGLVGRARRDHLGTVGDRVAAGAAADGEDRGGGDVAPHERRRLLERVRLLLEDQGHGRGGRDGDRPRDRLGGHRVGARPAGAEERRALRCRHCHGRGGGRRVVVRQQDARGVLPVLVLGACIRVHPALGAHEGVLDRDAPDGGRRRHSVVRWSGGLWGRLGGSGGRKDDQGGEEPGGEDGGDRGRATDPEDSRHEHLGWGGDGDSQTN